MHGYSIVELGDIHKCYLTNGLLFKDGNIVFGMQGGSSVNTFSGILYPLLLKAPDAGLKIC